MKNKTVLERLNYRSKKSTTHAGCIETTYSDNGVGYGQIITSQKRDYTHRAMWKEVNGPIPEGMFVLHKCDNPPCQNINHLFLGTQEDNLRDMTIKGRRRAPSQLGSKNANSKLSEDNVVRIRQLLNSGFHMRKHIAEFFEVKICTVDDITIGRRWGHVV